MRSIGFEEIAEKFRAVHFEEKFDLMVAVANGGIVPAALLNQTLGLDIQLLKLNLRGPDQVPLYDQPKLLEPFRADVTGKTILLVEDRVKTGTTLQLAKKMLEESGALMVKTFAVNGNADYCLYNEACFKFPWILT